MLNILIAPNALKGSLSARQAGVAIQKGIMRANSVIHTTVLPVADGGDGLLESMKDVMHGELKQVQVSNPVGRNITAQYLYIKSKKLAIIEMAEAVGLRLLKLEEYDPMGASTYGVGELILAALDEGAQSILLGIGGSATNDGGTGLATALGVRFLDEQGNALAGNANTLSQIKTIDMSGMDPRVTNLDWQVACDVNNPLLGERGAAKVYGPQKGANPEQVEQIEYGLDHFAHCLEATFNRNICQQPGAGAAGGMGAGLMAMFNVDLKSGAEQVLDILQFDKQLQCADLVITTEGKLDKQTSHGKAPAVIAGKAREKNLPCVLIAGQVDRKIDDLYDIGISAAFSLCSGPMDLEHAMQSAALLLEQSAEHVIRLYLAGKFSNKMRKGTMIKKCLFPAAGYGTRFLPATKAMPKEILPVLEKPLIQYGVEEALQAGMKEIAIITGRGKRAIEDHFDTNFELEHQINGTSKESLLTDIRRLINECTFSYTRQTAMRGLGDAILCGETLIGKEPFGVILADDLCEGDDIGVMQQMAEIYEKYRCSVIAIQEVDPSEVHKYGIIEGRELDNGVFMVSNMVEKPDPADAPSNLAIIGRYVLTPDIFEILKNTPTGKNGELQITDALQTQASDNMVIAYKFKGKRFDCGSIDGYVEATNYFYSRR